MFWAAWVSEVSIWPRPMGKRRKTASLPDRRRKRRGLRAGRARDRSELVKGLEKLFLALLEALVPVEVQGPFVLLECRRDVAPI